MVEAPGTFVEVNDTRVIIGKGLSLDSIKFPDFHMFDTNWKMKLHAEWSEELETEVVSIKLRHRRRNVDDIWSMDATVKIHFEQDWLKGEVQVDSQFSNQGQEIEILNCGTVVGKLNSSEIHLCVHIFMQVILNAFSNSSTFCESVPDKSVKRNSTSELHRLRTTNPHFFRHYSSGGWR